MLDIYEYVKESLERATVDELTNIIENGVELPDDDMREALERQYFEQAEARLKLLSNQ
jgi:Ran GTPase-activating protein (RanGAP) involved in mRNA processing and transport